MLKEAIFIKLCPPVYRLLEYNRTHKASEVPQLPQGTEVKLLGWVAVKNLVGGVVFLRLRDGSGFIQLSRRSLGRGSEGDNGVCRLCRGYSKGRQEGSVW